MPPISRAPTATSAKRRRAHRARGLAAEDERRRRCRLRGRLGHRRSRAQTPLHCQGPHRGTRGTGRDRPAGNHPAVLHARRDRRRHRLQQGGISRHRRTRPRCLADHRSADRGKRARLEGIRDGGRARPQRQLHHRLLDREYRPDGRAYRGFHHRRARADADRQGIPGHARRFHRGVARDRGRDRRLQCAVRRQSRGRPPRRHRDEPAGIALFGAGLQGDRIPDRQGRRQARRRLHARRDRK